MFHSVFEDDDRISKTPVFWLPRVDRYASPSLPCRPCPFDALRSTDLQGVITHVFFHPHAPFSFDSHEPNSDFALVSAVCVAARAYQDHISHANKSQWPPILKMLDKLRAVVLSQKKRSQKEEEESCLSEGDVDIASWLEEMITGDILAFPFRSQRTGFILRKQDDHTLYEPFEVLRYFPVGTQERISYSYPELVVEIPSQVFGREHFQSGLADFLSMMLREDKVKPRLGVNHTERYSTKILKGILRAVGHSAELVCITKHVCHYVARSSDRTPAQWSRSSLWLLTRIAIQSSLDRSPLGRSVYKEFTLFFMLNLANHAVNTSLASDLLHLMSVKIIRRFRKLHAPPQWLSDAVFHTCRCLSETLDSRWAEIQAADRHPLPFDPSHCQLTLTRDIRHTLTDAHKYILSVVTNQDFGPENAISAPFLCFQATLDDFLSSNGKLFREAYLDDPLLTLRTVERVIEEGIDHWLSPVDVDEACNQLEVLMEQYMSSVHGLSHCKDHPEYRSILILTAAELWVTIDKLVIKEIPILIDYSPLIPLTFLSEVLLPNPMAIHRVRRLYQYLSDRHRRAHEGWSVLSNEFTDDSFPVRYFDGSANLQRLKDDIGEDLPPLRPQHAKAVIFELQCPMSFQIWRSITCLLADSFPSSCVSGLIVYEDFLDLRSHSIRYSGSNIHLSYSTFDSHPWVEVEYTTTSTDELRGLFHSDNMTYPLPDGPYRDSGLQQYLDVTGHAPNRALSTQEKCHPDLPLHEFIAFSQLRSGSALQWINILRELRSRNLNFRRYEVFLLLAQASSQVGPLSDTGDLLWHQDLQDPSFCHALLGELESLFVDLSAGLSEVPGMATISLLARSAATNISSKDIVGRATQLLRNVRQKTFDWVQGLLYDLIKSPNEEGYQLLRDTATICRSTYSVGPAIINGLLHSAQDIEIALSCAFLIRASFPTDFSRLPTHSRLLLEQNTRLSLALVRVIKDAVQSDESDLGIDLAIRKVWPGYRPGSRRWEPFQHPDSPWLISQMGDTRNRPSQTILIHLLDGSLLLDGKPVCTRLPDLILDHPTYREIFGNYNFIVNPSDLPGMDFSTQSMTYGYYVHFSLRDGRLQVRAQREEEILVLIPPDTLVRDLHPMLVTGHVHWLNLSTSIIEIRPLSRIWEQSSDDWMVRYISGNYYHITKGLQSLVDIRSATWETISRPLEGLETSENLIITISQTQAQTVPSSPLPKISVSLPRYGLSFYVNNNYELESNDFSNMVYDENQFIGTLVGLVHRLVLRPRVQIEEDLTPRCVLIPEGELHLERDGTQLYVHVQVFTLPMMIDGYYGKVKEAFPKAPITYHTYKVDTELGCLTGITGQARLYLARLHALTGSAFRPDPLTGRTGLEEAISLAQSTQLKKFQNGPSGNTKSACVQWQEDELRATGSPQLRFPFESRRFDSRRHFPNLKTSADAMLQEAYLFPPTVGTSAWAPGQDLVHNQYRNPESVHTEDFAYIIALAVWQWSFSMPGTNADIPSWVDTWGDSESVLRDTSPSTDSTQRVIKEIQLIKKEIYSLFDPKSAAGFHLLFTLPTTLAPHRRFEKVSLYPESCIPDTAVLLLTLVAFARQPHVHWENLNEPCWDEYTLLDGYHPCYHIISNHIKASQPPLAEQNAIKATSELLKLWPSETLPLTEVLSNHNLHNVEHVAAILQPIFSRWYRNLKLKEYIIRILGAGGPDPHSISNQPWYRPKLSPDWRTTLDQLLRERPVPELPVRCRLCFYPSMRKLSSDTAPLHRLLNCLRGNEVASPFQAQYLDKLRDSADHVSAGGLTIVATHGSREKPTMDTLRRHYVQCRANYRKAFDSISETLAPKTDFEVMLYQYDQWPRVTPHTLFQCLASISPVKLSNDWKICLITLAHLALELQRARRLIHFFQSNLDDEFFKELENEINERVATLYPDWLLMELQCNFIIRPVQVDIAEEMMSPRLKKNSVIQVNMGEGKSSLIIPMCAAALADGNRLVRIIVPEALTTQMIQILTDRLGGLLGRPIFHLTVDRRHLDNVNSLQSWLSDCEENRGILIMQPEHVLSLKLACMERQLFKKGTSANLNSSSRLVTKNSKRIYKRLLTDSLLKQLSQNSYLSSLLDCLRQTLHQKSQVNLEGSSEGRNGDPEVVRESSEGTGEDIRGLRLLKFINDHARDILDESDEVLQPKLQLIYTIGHQQHVDGYPNRWVITQQILWLARKHASSVDPRKIEVEVGRPGSFPRIRILQVDGGAQLVSSIVEEVMDGHLSHLSIPFQLRKTIRDFISCKDVHPETAKFVEDYTLDNTTWGEILLLLRGLFANDILLFTLKERRWRVDYGLDLTRTLVAVPYRAKDVPSATAEFGHPDITIMLTYLSYYYGGLTENQLRDSFEILLEQDDPSKEYSLWAADCASEKMLPSLRTLDNINIRSTEQWKTHIVPLFSLSQRAIDFYLSKVVFPKNAKEYPWKISCSSWDIAERKGHLVTGFSGTNDAQYLLPISITQQDPENLRQTGSNAGILTYLLQPENSSYSLTADKHGERWTTLELLRVLVAEQPKIHVLLDVGACVLDLSNRQVAEEWLHIIPWNDASGVIYFNEENELMVLARNGMSQQLSSSPLNHALDQCAAYLDHAHTRGTDIKFPYGFRAAVTLGPKVTKDHLVQGCMRMRKLGYGHSVKFFSPPEVDHAIRLVTRKDGNAVITSADVLHWTIRETWTNIQRRAPRWVQQGVQHTLQHEAWTRFCHEELTIEHLTESYLQTEARTLADLYAPNHSQNTTNPMILGSDIRDRCEHLGISSLPNARLEEEQEREVSREVEREREVERPPEASPAEHFLHPDVTNFVKNGVILPTSTAFRSIFTTLDNTSATTRDAHVWTPYILATADFCQTITEEGSLKGHMDAYLRPVQWVLSGKMYGNNILVILSPFEADCLMPDIHLSEHVHLHPYTPRTSKTMKPCDDLKLYPIPPVPSSWTPPWTLIDQLNVFAGQLYFRDFESYVRLSRFLGVHREELPSDATTLTKPNWLKMPGSLMEETFEDSPLRFVTLLLAIRRRGIHFDDTHMGRLVQGWLLTKDDFPSFKPALPSHTAHAGEPHRGLLLASSSYFSPIQEVHPTPVQQACETSSRKRKKGPEVSPDIYEASAKKRRHTTNINANQAELE